MDTWFSKLRPLDEPDIFMDERGRFLPDFSYAGAKAGAGALSIGDGRIALGANDLDVTGKTDCRAVIQRALDALAKSGGGTLQLPGGTLRIDIPGDQDYGLLVSDSGIELRGLADGQTLLWTPTCSVRKKCFLQIGTPSEGFDNARDAFAPLHCLTRDVAPPTSEISIADTGAFSVGDYIILRADWTKAFIAEKKMGRYWKPSATHGQALWRRIEAIDPDRHVLRLDIPISFPMKTRDRARIYRFSPGVTDVAIRDLRLSGRTPGVSSGLGSLDYNDKRKRAYDLHAFYLVKLVNCADCVVENVKSSHCGNAGGYHMPSGGIILRKCRSITLENCDFSRSRYQGAGGNGYGFVIESGDCLLRNCASTKTRHALAFRDGNANGNVVTGFKDTAGRFPTDYHMHLSAANLIECSVCDRSFFEARNRGAYGSPGVRHGLGTENSVFWNNRGLRPASKGGFLICSKQRGTGFVIGTSGTTSGVRASPERGFERDFIEGTGRGETLCPQSLYAFQLERRRKREALKGGLDP